MKSLINQIMIRHTKKDVVEELQIPEQKLIDIKCIHVQKIHIGIPHTALNILRGIYKNLFIKNIGIFKCYQKLLKGYLVIMEIHIIIE